jgi:uncharacterized protein YjbJ (UPF0337 family)
MNKDQLIGRLTQYKGEMKRRWGKLTDDDITESHGDIEKLIGRIRERSGDRQEVIEKWFREEGLL